MLFLISDRAVHVDEGVDSLSYYSRLKAASIVVHRTLNGILDEPWRSFRFSSPCRRRFDSPGPQSASPGYLFPISCPFLKLQNGSTTAAAATKRLRHKQAASHTDDAKKTSFFDCDLFLNIIFYLNIFDARPQDKNVTLIHTFTHIKLRCHLNDIKTEQKSKCPLGVTSVPCSALQLCFRWWRWNDNTNSLGPPSVWTELGKST